MTASPSAGSSPSIAREKRLSTIAASHVLQRARTAYGEKQDEHDERGEEGRRCSERQVVTGRDVVVDHVRGELRSAAHDLHGDVVAKAEREREDRTRDDRGEEQREHD